MYIHTRYLLIREYIEDVIIKIKNFKSEDNMAEIMTQIVDGKTYKIIRPILLRSKHSTI